MKILYIYNPFNAQEVALIDRVKQELGEYTDEVVVKDFMSVQQSYHIAKTPALIIIREDMQGEHLLTEDPENAGKLRITAEAYKVLQEEESVIHNAEVNRIDNFIQTEVAVRVQTERDAYQQTIDMLLDNALL